MYIIAVTFLCKKHDCVFYKNEGCRLPEDKNLRLFDDNNKFHCINYITDINQVSKEEARKKYNL